MKTILVPLDFSALSHSTAHFGLKLAQRLNARLVLLHVVEPSLPLSVFNGPVGALGNWDNVLQDQMTGRLHQFEVQIREYHRQQAMTGVPLSTRIVVGEPASAIVDVAEAERASFIIMGTVGAANAWDKLIGSVASTVAQQANRPVWILPHAVELDSLRTFAYFADLAGDEVRCINQVMNLGERLHASLDVVHVSATGDEEESDAADAIIGLFEDDYALKGVTFRHLTQESANEGIEAYVRIHQPDALVLAHRNREFIEKLFHTSLVRYLSLTTKLPLLIIAKPG
ncbi:MAG: universal stress protein UspA [Spirosoma sp.]|nr:universal stress protein UspA [Spirosoma sp.]